MPNFKNGPVESPDYGEEANQFSQVTEFSTDVYVYGKLYADIQAGAIDFSGADNITFNGGLQFFNFDNSNILKTSVEIKNINLNTTYVTELREDRISNIYVYEPDINGKYIIKNNKEKNFTESEYSKVIFSLKNDNINNHPVYVVGNFNNYEINRLNSIN